MLRLIRAEDDYGALMTDPAWFKFHGDMRGGKYPEIDLVRFVARRRDAEGTPALDVGCGAGAHFWYLLREGYDVHGIDGVPQALEILESRLAAEGLGPIPDGRLKAGSFDSLPWPDEHFELVVDVDAITANKLDTIRKTVAEVQRVLKPGGAFFSRVFSTECDGYDKAQEVEPHTLDEVPDGPIAGHGTTHFFDEQEIRELFAAFQVELGYTTRTDRGFKVCEWLVQAEKPGVSH